MMRWIAGASPRRSARMAGILYLLNILTGAFAAFISGRFAAYGEAANLVATIFYILVTVLFYNLFKPVSRKLSLLAAFFSLLGCTVGVLNIFHMLPFHLSALAFFGVYCLLIGYLIVRSRFLPPSLGVLMIFAGVSWMTFLSPPLANRLSPYNIAVGILVEGSLTAWLLVRGLNAQHWEEQARAAMRSNDARRTEVRT